MQLLEDDKSCFVVTFLYHLGHAVYTDLMVKTSEISGSRIGHDLIGQYN